VVGLDRPDIDLTDDAAVRARVDEIIIEHGTIDALVNNAGATDFGSVLDTPLDQVDRLFAVNFRAPFALTQAVLPAMIAAGRGAIVNVTSDQALVGKRFSAAYGASKAALAQLTRSAALDFAAHDIRVNAIAPGSTDTAMLRHVIDSLRAAYPDHYPAGPDDAYAAKVPLGRFADPAEIANLVAFLVSDRSSFMTGAVIPIDGGETAA
jgi:NAD(P)-dependent dehydrogenase (short-subunit alcohol dehydrogenase family)